LIVSALSSYDFKVDSSVTPRLKWDVADYTTWGNGPRMLGSILEVPVTVVKGFFRSSWLRSSYTSFDQMEYVIGKVSSETDTFVHFLHSYELLEGGPYLGPQQTLKNLRALLGFISSEGGLFKTMSQIQKEFRS
jgi:hypothetical protein